MHGELLKKIEKALHPQWDGDGFDLLAGELLEYQAAANPVYARFLKGMGFFPAVGIPWRQWPALPSAAFRENAVCCFPPEEAIAVFETSGTTAKQTGRHYFDDLHFYERALEAGFRRALPDCSKHCWVSLIPARRIKPRSSLAHMIGRLDDRLKGGNATYVCDRDYGLDAALLLEVLSVSVADKTPVALFGTSFALADAAEEVRKRMGRIPLPEGSLVFDTGGYKGRRRELSSAELHGLLEDALGIPVSNMWNEYGMTELSSQGYANGRTGLHLFPPWLKAEIRSPATNEPCGEGEAGLLHFYDLANVGSVMAVSTMDQGVREGGGIRVLGRMALADVRGCSLPYEP